MKNKKLPRALILAESVDVDQEPAFAHPLNPKSEVRGVSLSELAGMERIGVHIVSIAPGKEAFIYHTHTTKEEFIYILSGRGIAEIDEEEYEVGPGDFMGFLTPSVAHLLRNPFEEKLVYLLGGEQKDVEINDFPRIGKRIVRIGSTADIVDHEYIHPFWRGGEE